MSKGGEKHRAIFITPLGHALLEVDRLKGELAAVRKAFDNSLNFIEEWSNWWSYALEKPDGSEPTEADNQKAHELGDRAAKTVIDGRRLLKEKPHGS